MQDATPVKTEPKAKAKLEAEQWAQIPRRGPDLTGRRATCSCGKTEPSSHDLPFFQYRGPGSEDAAISCVCGYYEVAHLMERKAPGCCPEFKARGPMHDLYYCGCRGWD